MTCNGDDAVYASILNRMEPSEQLKLLQKVMKKEHKAIQRRICRVSESLSSLRQLHVAAARLRPSGDWISTTLQTQLKSIEEFRQKLEIAVENLENVIEVERKKKRRRRFDKEIAGFERKVVVEESGKYVKEAEKHGIEMDSVKREKEIIIKQEQNGPYVDFFEVEDNAERLEGLTVRFRDIANCGGCEVLETSQLSENGKPRIEIKNHHREVGDSVSKVVTTEGNEVEDGEITPGKESDHDCMRNVIELPFGLISVTSETSMRMKMEPMTLQDLYTRKADSQDIAQDRIAVQDEVESPIELQLPESSDSEESGL
ncbi:uncharacterized protein PHALS_12688 [Plasmopara halstedii]|uniref:Uncharacterized protein n=1 Tax=Plasmopara halstedii TaxID=4781 RepID=A0A0P1ANU3_PLAHL|nr:uncharacterized protein PHALS_12688 [Plasmopara halstedii]CEG42410.1 hypothetical protein PHALS_12688 [Plasmopara halstedii]|eukprot:XP_024578779.1 hypothetical protein PHALS_12688 [Plasmopara halstedii]